LRLRVSAEKKTRKHFFQKGKYTPIEEKKALTMLLLHHGLLAGAGFCEPGALADF
jgi:hypothetical protein